MDRFGVGVGLLSAAHGLEVGSRRSGRTERLLASLSAGDRVICADSSVASDLRLRCMALGLRVNVAAMPVGDVSAGQRLLPRVPGATVFHYDWVEAHFRHVLMSAGREIYRVETEGGVPASSWRALDPVHRALYADPAPVGFASKPARCVLGADAEGNPVYGEIGPDGCVHEDAWARVKSRTTRVPGGDGGRS